MKVQIIGPREPKRERPDEISWDLGLGEPVFLSFWADRKEVCYSIEVTEDDLGNRELSVALI